MISNRKLRVFLCHASQDKPIVRELYQRLNAEGWIDPWLDEEKLLPGQDWDLEIEKAVEIADTVIVCLSSNSVTKEGYIQKELRKVLNVAEEKPDGAIFIIPIKLNRCEIPRRLNTLQYLEYFPKKNRDYLYSQLIQSLDIRAASLYDKDKTIVLNNLPQETSTYRAPRKSKIAFSPSAYIPREGDLAALYVLQAEDKAMLGEWIVINDYSVTIGRAMDTDIVFSNDNWVSRYHAMVEFTDTDWVISELTVERDDRLTRPANGTFVNKNRIKDPVVLHDEDVINLGGTVELLFRRFV